MNPNRIAQELLINKHSEEFKMYVEVTKEVIDKVQTVKDNNPIKNPHINIEELIQKAVQKTESELISNIIEYLDTKLKEYVDNKTTNKILHEIKKELFASNNSEVTPEISIWNPKDSINNALILSEFEESFSRI